MIKQLSNIVQQQHLTIEFAQCENAMELQSHIAEVFYQKLEPEMNALLDELFGENYYASIDKLDIDCGVLDSKNWQQDFVESAIRKLKEELVQIDKKKIPDAAVLKENAAETFFSFLENGFLPWNTRINTQADLEELVSIDDELVSRLKNG